LACELCNLEVRTKLYYHDDSWVIVDCEKCKIPMAVLKRHSDLVSRDELGHLLSILAVSFPREIQLHTQAGKITDHIHFHLVIPEDRT